MWLKNEYITQCVAAIAHSLALSRRETGLSTAKFRENWAVASLSSGYGHQEGVKAKSSFRQGKTSIEKKKERQNIKLTSAITARSPDSRTKQ